MPFSICASAASGLPSPALLEIMRGIMIKKVLSALKYELKVLRGLLYHRLYIAPHQETKIVDQFHHLYYDSHVFYKTFSNTAWLGTPILKCPLDLWIYQECIYDLKPDLIVECGTAYGGSALYLASICDLVGHGKVVTIDIEGRPGLPAHPRIDYLTGSSVSDGIVKNVRDRIADHDKIMVILDSDHRKDHVLQEMAVYGDWVTPGSYLIVEDTNMNGHPVEPDFGPGPMEAVEEFLKTRDDFVIDTQKEKFYLSFNPRGYLKKVR